MIKEIRKVLESEDVERPRVNIFDYVGQGKVRVDEMSTADEDRFLRSAENFNKRMELGSWDDD